MKFIVRRASQFFHVSESDPPCKGAVLEEMKVNYAGHKSVEKVWTIELPETLRGFINWVGFVGDRVVIERIGGYDLYVITIYDYWIE